VQHSQREAVLGARLMVVQGELQSELGVIHVIADKMRDYSHWLGRVRVESRDFR
jgi:error-prone DNA polymerase